MREFTGTQYLQIDIANTYGLDGVTWDERLDWFQQNRNCLWDHVASADRPLMYEKAVLAWEKAKQGKPTGHIMYLDATASGYQIMAALSGCYTTAEMTNLVHPGKRVDLYQEVVDRINTYLGKLDYVNRDMAKKPIMTHTYNKGSQEAFTGAQAEAFYKVIENTFPGPERVRMHLNSCWNPKGLVHSWILPDGHTSHVPVIEQAQAKIEVDELDHAKFSYVYKTNKSSNRWTSLAPNVIHSIDGYLARQMVKLCNFPVVTIHDAFGCHPNNMNKVRSNYIKLLHDIHNSDILNNICTALGKKRKVKKDKNLSKYILNSEYPLS